MNALEKISLSSIKIFFKPWGPSEATVHVGRSRVDGKTLALILVGGEVTHVCTGLAGVPLHQNLPVQFQGDPSSYGTYYNRHPLCVHQSFL